MPLIVRVNDVQAGPRASAAWFVLIPLRTADIDAEDRVAELSEYQEMTLRPAYFDQDLSKVVSTMLRDFQRRNR